MLWGGMFQCPADCGTLLSSAPRWVAPSVAWLVPILFGSCVGDSRNLFGMGSPVMNSYFKAFVRCPSLLCCECMFATSR